MEHLRGQWRSERIGALHRGSGCALHVCVRVPPCACVCVTGWLACAQGCARARARVCAPVRMCPRCACVHSARACGVCVRAGVHMCACGACADGCRCACCVPLRVCACVHACMLTLVCVCACLCVRSNGCAFLMCDLSLGGHHCLSPGLGEARPPRMGLGWGARPGGLG